MHGDGTVSIKREGSVRKTWEGNAKLRKEKPSTHEMDSPVGRMIGSMPADVHQEMRETYGDDGDAQKAFLRDNPNFAVVKRNNLDAPSKRLTFGPMSHVSDEQWGEIFSQRKQT